MSAVRARPVVVDSNRPPPAQLKVGPAVAYTPTGAGPAAPGKAVLRKPKAGDLLTVRAMT